MREKKSPCELSTFSEFSFFSRESHCIPLFSGTFSDIFGYYQTVKKNPGTLRIKRSKNVIPIN